MITPTYSGNRQQKVPRLETAGGFSVCKKSALRGALEDCDPAMVRIVERRGRVWSAPIRPPLYFILQLGQDGANL